MNDNNTESSMEEVEQDRQHRLEELNAEEGTNWINQYRPGSFGCHELLDRVALLSRLVDEQVAEHPSCLLNAEWYALARQASETLADLYQRIGAEHL